ncbi:12974_t:CDS:2, partial [Racocetra fulgida]
AHSWILQQIKQATNSATPQVIFTDADPALLSAIRDEFPTTNSLHCMFHIAQNIPLNLKNHLKDNYDEFIKDFFEVQRVSFVTIFEYRWKCLLDKYSNENVINYLRRLYAKKLTACVLEEDKKTEYALFRASVPKAALVATADSILPNVCKMLRKYLTVEMLKIQEDQIKQSLQYHATIVVQEELQRFLNVKSFLVAQKFGMEQSVTMGWNGLVPYLNALNQGTVYEMKDINRKTIDERKLTSKIEKRRLDPKELMNPHKRKATKKSKTQVTL